MINKSVLTLLIENCQLVRPPNLKRLPFITSEKRGQAFSAAEPQPVTFFVGTVNVSRNSLILDNSGGAMINVGTSRKEH